MRALAAIMTTACVCAYISGTLTSCNTQGCTENRSALPLAGFYSAATEASVILDSLDIGGIGAPDDSLLLKAGHAAYNLYLPFRADRETTSFRIHYAYPQQGLDSPEFDDIIEFRYTSTPQFASEECGAYYAYTITGVEYTRHLIDSVAVTDPVITNVEMERIRIFFRIGEDSGSEAPAPSTSARDAAGSMHERRSTP